MSLFTNKLFNVKLIHHEITSIRKIYPRWVDLVYSPAYAKWLLTDHTVEMSVEIIHGKIQDG